MLYSCLLTCVHCSAGTPTCGAQAAVQQLLQQQQQQLTAPYAISALQATAVSAAVAPGPLAQSNTSTPRSRSDSSSSCNARLDPALAAAFIAAVYDTVRQQQVMPEQQLQVERHKLQTQEYKYYAGKAKDSTGSTGSISKPGTQSLQVQQRFRSSTGSRLQELLEVKQEVRL